MIARGGLSFIVMPPLLAALFMTAAILFASNVAFLLTLPLGVLFLAFIVFFRDPPREIGRGIVSPADGRVLEAHPEARHVAIYMGILNVHVNRAPWSGEVANQERRAGGHAPASSASASRNSSLEWLIDSPIGEISLVQVTGIFARRIVPYISEGARIKKGQRIGLIRFGSRVEITLPPTVRILAKVGDRVRAGETTIAEVTHAR